jgi:glycosyltransferase involved in cell wall biosynthesis
MTLRASKDGRLSGRGLARALSRFIGLKSSARSQTRDTIAWVAIISLVVLTVRWARPDHGTPSFPANAQPKRSNFCAAINPADALDLEADSDGEGSFFRTFWPDHAEYMVLPGDTRRTGTACPSRVGDAAHHSSAVITVVTDVWDDHDFWRVHAMGRALQRQSYAIRTWWVVFAAKGDPRDRFKRTLRALHKYGTFVKVVPAGSELVNALKENNRPRPGSGSGSGSGAGSLLLTLLPTHVLIDDNFNSILEYTAYEKMVVALETHEADAVSSWSVSFSTAERTQHFSTRTPRSRHGAFMLRASETSGFWESFARYLAPPITRSVVSLMLCDAHRKKVVVLPDFLFWEETRHTTAVVEPENDPECLHWANDDDRSNATNGAGDGRALFRLTDSQPSESGCPQASLMLMVPWLEYGGADQFNVNLVRNLAQPYNVHVVLVTTTAGSAHPVLGDIAAVTEDIFHLEQLVPTATTPRGVGFVDAVSYLATTRQVDVLLLSNSEPGYLSLPAIRFRLPSVKIVDYVHSAAIGWRDGGFARYSLDSQRWLDHTLVASDGLKEWLATRGRVSVSHVSLEPTLHVVYVGVNPRECRRLKEGEKRAIRRKYGIPLQRPAIVFPARMSPEKNPARFFAIVKRLLQQHPDVTVIAVGGGALFESLKQNVTRDGIHGNVILTGALPHKEALKVLRASDVMMLTSDYEGISLSIFEGMAAGVVPFSTDVGSQKELVTPDAGVLVPLDRDVVDNYARALHDLLDDPRRLAKMKQAAYKRIRAQFDVAYVPLRIREAICR